MSQSEARTRPLSGRYRGLSCNDPSFEVDLRIDVDASQPSRSISADIFEVTPVDRIYRGSLVVVQPDRADDKNGVTFSGRADPKSSRTATPWIEVRIPRVGPDETRCATLARFDARRGKPGPVYDCTFDSKHFRRVTLIEDYEKDVKPVELDDTAVIKSEKTGRQITIVSAYDEAGIELQTGKLNQVDPRAVGEDGCWSDAELHAAMVNRLDSVDSTTAPEWAVWLLHARMHERDRPYDGSKKTYGILFDREPQRHGCAVFYGWLQEGSELESRRSQVYACVHEIGHSFNLKHCWSESILGPGRPDALSWLNYPFAYPRGEKQFWDEFDFSFDAPECRHLRHAYYNDIIMAGGRWPQPPHARDPGARLQVFAPRELQYGVPVAVGLKMTSAEMPSPPIIGPRAGNVEITIRRPDRTEFVFEPLLHHCRADEATPQQSVSDYAFVHYGKGGFAFRDPGRYALRARYLAPDGSILTSDPVLTTIRPPLSHADRGAQKLLSDDATHGQVGELMSLVGSSAETLQKGDEELQDFIDRHPHHPVAAVARLALGTNAARAFKTIGRDGRGSCSPRDETRAKSS